VVVDHRPVLRKVIGIVHTGRSVIIDGCRALDHHDVATQSVAVEVQRNPWVVDNVPGSR